MIRPGKIYLLLFLSLITYHSLLSQSWDFTNKLSSSDVSTRMQMGFSIAISDDYMLVGAPSANVEKDGNNYSNAGAAYLFLAGPNDTWEEVQKIESPSPKSLGYFGTSVAMEGVHVLVGAYNEYDEALDINGRVYSYLLVDGELIVKDTLIAEQIGNSSNFGITLEMTEDFALIGAPRNHYDEEGENYILESGAAFIFKRNQDHSWTKYHKIVSQERKKEDNFGHYLDLDEGGAIISSSTRDESPILLEAGAAYSVFCDGPCDFENIDSDDFAKIVPPDASGLEFFGADVAISGDWLAVGRAGSNGPELGDGPWGAVDFFHWENGSWLHKQKVHAGDAKNNASFGSTIAMDGPICVIGASSESTDENDENQVFFAGAAYIFELQNDGSWQQVRKLAGTERDYADSFGAAIDLDETKLGIGAWGADTLDGIFINEGGVFYTFERDEPLIVDPISSLTAINKNDFDFTFLDNPSQSGMLQLLLNGHETNSTSIIVSSIDGTLVSKEQFFTGNSFKKDLSYLPKGSYMVTLMQSNKKGQSKLWIRQ